MKKIFKLMYKLLMPNGKLFDQNKTYYDAYVEADTAEAAKEVLAEDWKTNGLTVEIVSEPTEIATEQIEEA